MFKRFVGFAALTVCALFLFAGSVYAAELDYNGYRAAHGAPAAPDAQPVTVDARAPQSAVNASERDGCLLSEDDTELTYAFSVPVAGHYFFSLRYAAVPGSGLIIRQLRLDGETPFTECTGVTLRRYYRDANKDFKTQSGNQDFPAQVEVQRFTDMQLGSVDGDREEPYVFFLEAGPHTLELTGVNAAILMDTITVAPYAPTPSYAEYDAANRALGLSETAAPSVKVQAEDAVYKTSPSLYPVNDRTTPVIEPYHPTYITLNSIGNMTWDVPGETAEWEVNVPADGLYAIAVKAKQSAIRGAFSSRTLRINGAVPFKEAQAVRFPYSTKYRLNYISGEDGAPYLFRLNAGVNSLSLEASLGAMAPIVDRVNELLRRSNLIYQDVAVITGATPDKYRDYNLYGLIPDLSARLKAECDEVRAIMTAIEAVSDSYAGSTAILGRYEATLTRVLEKPERLTSYFVDLKACISALGDWMVQALQQPLQMDYLIASRPDAELPAATGSFLQNLWHGVQAFIGSFTNDFDSEFARSDTADAPTIEVWVSAGYDQYTTLNRLISESFARAHGISVDLRLIHADAIIPATITGMGPDVNIQLAGSTPVNFGYRNAAADLTQFADFPEVAARFAPAAVDTFRFDGAVYALPDQMSFNVMLIRTDVFDRLGLRPPDTMDELLDMVPALTKNTMEVYFSSSAQPTVAGSTAATGQEALGAAGATSAKNFNSVFASILYQHGAQLYADDGARTALSSPEAVEAFKYWTELYTKHTFVVTTDFASRFRLGEVPLGVIDFSMYNRLSVSAPEIRGDWVMMPIPGIVGADGTLRRDVSLNVSGSMIVEQTARKNGNMDAAWEFLKWWTSADTQYSYAVQMESIMGLAGRHPVANLEAFQRIGWSKADLEVLNASLEWARAIPQVPGGYLAGRVIDNAFVSVITEDTNANATDALYKACEQLNDELAAKRREFGLAAGIPADGRAYAQTP